MTVRLVTYDLLSYLYVDGIPESDETVIIEVPQAMPVRGIPESTMHPELQRYAKDMIEEHLTQMKKGIRR